jgi:AraC-like DNA-binding protein
VRAAAACRRTRRRPSPLPKWRLKRVVDYIEANVTKPIYLAELSNVAGLTRMHFAAQFRAATGCSPYNHILRRKVAYSQRLLLDPQLSIAHVAAVMGFSSQAHFTVVFKRVVGKTPVRWRQSITSTCRATRPRIPPIRTPSSRTALYLCQARYP